MQMENARVTLTPLALSYCSRRQLSVIVKMKRILISTNYQLQKFQCKKHFTFKNNSCQFVKDASHSNIGFTFNLSKQLQLANTKIDVMIFGLSNASSSRDISLLGIATVDLGLFQDIDFKDSPYLHQIKLKLNKCQDPLAHIVAAIKIQSIKKNQLEKQQNQKQIKPYGDNNFNSLKTQSYNKQQLLIGRRKNPEIPTGYEVSRKNYKQTEIIRITQSTSKQKSKNKGEMGSYKKRFQYQYRRQVTSRDGQYQNQQQPQVPPKQRPQNKKQQRGSPVPRLKTPQPINDHRYSQPNQHYQQGQGYLVVNKHKKKQRANKTYNDSYENSNSFDAQFSQNASNLQKYNKNRSNNNSKMYKDIEKQRKKYRDKQQQFLSELGSSGNVLFQNSNKLKIIIDVHKSRQKSNEKSRQKQMLKYYSQQFENGKGNSVNVNRNIDKNINKLKQQQDPQQDIVNNSMIIRPWQHQHQLNGNYVSNPTIGNTHKQSSQNSKNNSNKKTGIISQQNINIYKNPSINRNPNEQSSSGQENNQVLTHDDPNKKDYPTTAYERDGQTGIVYNNLANPGKYKQVRTDRYPYPNTSDFNSQKQQYQNEDQEHNAKNSNNYNYNYNQFRHARSYQQPQQHRQQPKQQQQPKYPQSQSPLPHAVKPNPKMEKTPSNNGHTSKSISSGNRFKDIADKFAKIQEKIKQKNKSSSPSQNNQETDYNAANAKNRGQANRPKPRKEIDLHSSTNTFKQHMQSQYQQQNPHDQYHESSSHQTSKHIKSFQPNPQLSQSQDLGPTIKHQNSRPLDSIVEESGHFNYYSDSNIKITQGDFVNQSNSKQEHRTNDRKPNNQHNENKQMQQNQLNNQNVSKFDNSSPNKKGFEKSVGQFSVNDKQQPRQYPKSIKKQSADQNRRNQQFTNIFKGKPQQKNIPHLQDQGMQTSTKKQNKRKPNNQITNQFQIRISATPQTQPKSQQIQNKTSIDSMKNSQSMQNQKIVHKGCEEKINNLEHMLDQQEEDHRKQLMQKQLEYRTIIKNQQKKRKQQHQRQLSILRDENMQLRQKLKKSKQPNASKNQDRQLLGSQSIQIGRLKDQNIKLRDLVTKLNSELQQNDQKHFQALTATEKKDLEYQRKLDGFIKKNAQLAEEIKRKDQEFKQYIERVGKNPTSLPQIPRNKNVVETAVSAKTLPESQKLKQGTQQNGKSFQQQFLAEKKKNVNLQAQVRIKDNQLRFLKIKNENLMQQKRDLQNQIDNIAANNKLQMAKQGSISKINLQASSVTNSVKVQNKVLKQQINSLRKQVHQLNSMLQGIITQTSQASPNQRSFSKQESALKQQQDLQNKKYEALEKKTQAYEQEIKNKQMKIAEIINLIFSHGNPKLMDQVSKLVGMVQN